MSRYRPQLVGAFLAAVALACFLLLARGSAQSLAILSLDASLTSAVQSVRVPWLTSVMIAATMTGDTITVAVLTGLVAAWLVRRARRDEALFVAATVAVGAALSSFAKGAIGRARPPAENALLALPGSFSFPSGHAMGSLCLASAVGYLVVTSDWPWGRKLPALLLVVAYPLVVGFTRVYLGVHWPSDILASWLLGGTWVIIASTLFLFGKGGRGSEAPA